METIKDLYVYSKSAQKPLLCHATFKPTMKPMYDETFTDDFLSYYKTNYKRFDRMFAHLFASKTPIYFDKPINVIDAYDDFVELCESVFNQYLDEWQVLYYAMRQRYNPLYNVDGVETETTEGQVKGLSGNDTKNDTFGEVTIETDTGVKTGNTRTYKVPYDTTNEKETDHTQVISNAEHDEVKTNEFENESTTTYGMTDNVDYTVTRKRGGNIGTTKTQDLILSQIEVTETAFYNVVFKTIAETVSIW